MKIGKTFLFMILSILWLSPTSHSQTAKRPMTVADVLKVKSVFDTQISPDGKWILFGVSEADLKENCFNADLWLVSSNGGEPIRMTYNSASESNWQWSPDGKRIAFLSDRQKQGLAQIYLLSMNGGEAEQLTTNPTAIQFFLWSPDGNKIAYLAQEPPTPEQDRKQREKEDASVVDRDFHFTHLWLLEIATKKITQLTRGPFQINSFSWSPDGKEIVFSHQPTPKVQDLYHADISLVTVDGTVVKMLIQRPGFDINPQFSPDGKKIAFVSQAEDTTWYGNSYLCVFDRKHEKTITVTGGFDNQIGNYGWTKDGNAFYFVASNQTDNFIWSVAGGGGNPKPFTALPGVSTGFSLSADGKWLSFIHHDGAMPPEVFVTATSKFAPRKLTSLHGYLSEFVLSKPEIIHWRARDGKTIEGLLYKPVGYQQDQRVPLLTVVHGGPAGSYLNSFATGYVYPYQVFAGQGCALLLPNPRGSGTYGYAFRKANYRDWGGEDYWDIQCGIDSLIQKGIADPQRLAIMGWSYGGFMTAWTITQTDRFKAASVGAGVTNLYSFTGATDIPEFMNSYWGAWPWNDPELFRSHSALYHIKNVKTPTLIQHGEADMRVPIAQGRELYMGLKKNGVATEFVIYPRQLHRIGEPRLLLDAMRRNVEWMNKWILGQK